jgi:hypothetical protein
VRKPKSKTSAQRILQYAEGGPNKLMFGPQAAGPAKSGRTGKIQTPAPGAKFAKGGKSVDTGGRSVPAKAGRTGPSVD